MPVLNPAVLPPVEAPLAPLRASAHEHALLRLRQVRIHLLGPQVLDAPRMQAAIDGATQLSDALRTLAQLHHAAGYPAAQLRYALDGDDLYVLVVLGVVESVQAPAPLRAYFEDLAGGDAPLTDDRFEPRRALASVHADRAGLNAEPLFQPQDDGAGYLLDLKPDDGGPDRSGLVSEYNNHGNRFVGRHFLDTELHHGSRRGDEFSLSWRTALTGLDSDSGAQQYDEYGVGWSRVTPRGVFGLTGQHVRYDFELRPPLLGVTGPTAAQSEHTRVELSWQYPLAADFNRRWLVSALLDHNDKRTEARGDGARLQDQAQAAAEVGTAWSRVWRWTDAALEVGGGTQLRHGLGEDRSERAHTQADLGYWLLRPEAGVTGELGDNWSLRLHLAAQLTRDTLPEEAQWVLGGVESLHAWLPGVAIGDRGTLLRIHGEYRGWEPWPRWQLLPTVFAEAGSAAFDDPAVGPTRRGTAWLSDVGAGVVVKAGPRVEAGLAMAAPLAHSGLDAATRDEARADAFFHFSLRF